MIKIPDHITKQRKYSPAKMNFDDSRLIVLSGNENNFGTSPLALEALANNLHHLNRYPDAAHHDFKERLSRYHGIDKECFAVGNGVDGIMYVAAKAFFEKGDEILTSEKTFFSFILKATLHEIPVKQVAMKVGYRFDLEAIYEAITENTKCIYLCNSNNPTGTMITAEELLPFLAKVPSHILVMLDEAYFEFANAFSEDFPDGMKLLEKYDNLLIYRTFSKAYGLAGLRIGYAAGAPYLINALEKSRNPFEPNRLSLIGGMAALDDDDFLAMTLAKTKEGLQYFEEEFSGLGWSYIPSFANFVTVKFPSIDLAGEICAALGDKQIFVRQLLPFDMPDYVRISVGRPEENERLLKEIKGML